MKKNTYRSCLHSKAYMVIVWDKIKNIEGIYCKGKIIDDKKKLLGLETFRKIKFLTMQNYKL